MSEQCEGCGGEIGRFDKTPVLCEECQDKAASFDNCKAERDFLLKAAQAASTELSNLNLEDVSDMAYKTGRANGHLLAALNYCGVKV